MKSMSRRKRIALRLLIGIPIALAVLVLGAFTFFLLRYQNISRDCIWRHSAVAFVDTNGNGVRDPAEPPLKDVYFRIDDTYNHFTDVGSAHSNVRGEADLSVWLPGCPTAEFEVHTDPIP